MAWFDIYRAPKGDPEHDDNVHVGVVKADSLVAAVHIAYQKVECIRPATLWASDGDVSADTDAIRLNDLPDLPNPPHQPG